MMTRVFKAAKIFDGWRMHIGAAVSINADGRITALHPAGASLPDKAEITDLGEGILVPGMVDLQVNGGDGVLIGGETDVAQIERICETHMRLGATAILPTLISDTAAVTRKVIAAGIEAARREIPGFAGLHLEGPHLDPARRGAHNTAHLRPMNAQDLEMLCDAARSLPALIVTVAPEQVTHAQISSLHNAGAIISLGHSGCSATEARDAHAAGATLVTHLYNGMGALQNRSPGLVGAALTSPFTVGIIADGVHVAPECLLVALAMKEETTLFLVSDAMAAAGSTADHFTLNGRQIMRCAGRLTLEDGTLAGADISLPQSVAFLVQLGVPHARALAMASRIPAGIIHANDRGHLKDGARADMVFLSNTFELEKVFIAGQAKEL